MPTATKKRRKARPAKDEPLKLFEFHSFVPEKSLSGNAVGTCPFCNKDGKFFINEEDGRFDCKSCSVSGNKYTFLQLLYESCLEGTRKSRLASVSEARQGIPASHFAEWGLAYDNIQRAYLIPYYNDKGSIVNLGRWSGVKGSPIVKTPGCNLHLFGIQRLEKHGIIYFCESEWDAIALDWLLSKVMDGPYSVVASPGAGVFKEDWIKHFTEREVVVVGDNDDPGRKGVEKKIANLSKANVKSLQVVAWPESFRDGYDMEDMVAEGLKVPNKTFRKLGKFVQPVSSISTPVEEIEPIENFQEVVRAFRKHIHLSKEMEDCLAVMFAVCFSIRQEEVPLWCFIVGPAGSGKTLLLQSVGNTHWTHFESSIGPRTLVSGSKADVDPSLLPRLIGKTLVVKDWTEMLTAPFQVQEEVLSTLRGVYDGRYEKTYGNGVIRVYPDESSPHKTCRFSLLSGVTNAIHKHDRADLGERFIKFELKEKDVTKNVERALSNVLRGKSPEFSLRPISNAFLAREVNLDRLPTVPKWMEDRIVGLATILSYIRAKVERHQGRLLYRPVKEVPTRLAMQLLRLGQFLAFVYGKNKFDDECYRLVRKVALDTCDSWTREVFLCLLANPDGMEAEDIAEEARVERTQTYRSLSDLRDLGAAVRIRSTPQKKRSQGRNTTGQPPFIWTLSKSAKIAVRRSKLKG